MGFLPRVVIDARMVQEHGHGIANYVQDLALGLAQLREQGKLEYDLIFLTHLSGKKQIQLSNFPTFAMDYGFLHPLENWEIPKMLTSLRADLYHSPSFSSLPFCPCPYIQTIHDLNHLHFSSIAKRFYYHTLLKYFARRARKIITVSNFSQQEIANWLDISRDEIEVVYNAIHLRSYEKDLAREEMLLRRFSLQKGKYFFTLSSTKKHKNLPMIINAYRELKPEWPLVLPLPENTISGDGIICVGPIANDHAIYLLHHAGAFLFPSLYEGFGRPPLEAVCLGVPLLVSDISPHREGLQGIHSSEYTLLPPKDKDSWKQAMQKAMQGNLKRPGVEAKSWVESTYSVQNLAKKMDLLYKQNIRKFKA